MTPDSMLLYPNECLKTFVLSNLSIYFLFLNLTFYLKDTQTNKTAFIISKVAKLYEII